MSNLLIAIQRLSQNPIQDLVKQYDGSNRANAMGSALEEYIKDLFAGCLPNDDSNEINNKYAQVFSLIGSQNHPPDLMLKNSDAIEIKKVKSTNSGIQLNSSYPKAKLFANSPMLTKACKTCEEWNEKDIIYAIGFTDKGEKKLSKLWFVYGDCYAADKEIYENTKAKIKNGIDELPGIELSETKELGRINRVDPLGITYFRMRGMWGMENPIKTFAYLNANDADAEFEVTVLIKREKYENFPQNDISTLEQNSLVDIEQVSIKNPNNPAQLMDAILLSYRIT